MLAKEVHLQMLLKRCDILSSSGGGWQLIPPERNRERFWRVTFCLVVKEQKDVTHSVT